MASSSSDPLQRSQLDINTLRDNASDDVINHLFSVMDMGDQRSLARTAHNFHGIFNKSIRGKLFNILKRHLINRENHFLSEYELDNLHIILSDISSVAIHKLNFYLKYPFRTKYEKIELIDWISVCIEKINNPTLLKIIFDLLLSDTEYTNKKAFIFNDETIKDIKTAIALIHKHNYIFYMYNLYIDPDLFSIQDSYLQLKLQVESDFTQDSVKQFFYFLLINKTILKDHSDQKERIEAINKKIAIYQSLTKHTDPNSDIFNGPLLKLSMFIDEKATNFVIQLAEDLEISLDSIKLIDPCDAIIGLLQRKTIDNYCAQHHVTPEQKIKLIGHFDDLLGRERYPYFLEQQIEKLNILFDEIIGENKPALKHMLLISLLRLNRSVDRFQDHIEIYLYSFKKIVDSKKQSGFIEEIMELFNQLLFSPNDKFVSILYDICDALFKFNFEYEHFWKLIIKLIASISSYEILYEELNDLSFSLPTASVPLTPPSLQSKNVRNIINNFTYLASELPPEYLSQPRHVERLFDLAKAFIDHTFIQKEHALFKNKKFWDVFVSHPGVFLNMQHLDSQKNNIDANLFLSLLEDTPKSVEKLYILKDVIPQLIHLHVPLNTEDPKPRSQNLFQSERTSNDRFSFLSILLKLPDPIFSRTCLILNEPGTQPFGDPLLVRYCQLFVEFYRSLTQPNFKSFIQFSNTLSLDVLSNLIENDKFKRILEHLRSPDDKVKNLLSELYQGKITVMDFYQALPVPPKPFQISLTINNHLPQSSNAGYEVRKTLK